LLSRGARRIYAVDVGHGQLVPKIAQDSRIINLEQLNAKDITAHHIPDPLDMVVCDLSFISVTKALAPVLSLVKQGGHLVCLIKPQFEAGREMVGKKGVVKSPLAHHQAIDLYRWVGGLAMCRAGMLAHHRGRRQSGISDACGADARLIRR
jgi:23S rRNA (cytidine1920-2'-O)/16S rRNA (cytidine1409-2'-O)-methyltransferase